MIRVRLSRAIQVSVAMMQIHNCKQKNGHNQELFRDNPGNSPLTRLKLTRIGSGPRVRPC